MGWRLLLKVHLLKVHPQVTNYPHKGLQDPSQFDLHRKMLDQLLLLVLYHLLTVKLYLNENLLQVNMHLHLHEDLL